MGRWIQMTCVEILVLGSFCMQHACTHVVHRKDESGCQVYYYSKTKLSLEGLSNVIFS